MKEASSAFRYQALYTPNKLGISASATMHTAIAYSKDVYPGISIDIESKNQKETKPGHKQKSTPVTMLVLEWAVVHI